MSLSDRWKKGAETFARVIGFTPPERGPDFLRLTVENLFADVWAREGLSIRDRRLITITLLAASLKEESLALHLKQALASGDFTRQELDEVMIHLAHYAGWPTGQLGSDVLHRVAKELKASST